MYKEKLKQQLGSLLQAKNVALFSSCRNALYTLLLSFDLAKGDEIIVQKFICDSLPNAITAAGGKPVLVEVDEKTFNLDLEEVKKNITDRTKAIIFVHTYGNPSGIVEVKELCKERGLILIEDIAHALGASYGGKKAGSFGDYTVYSFTKQLINFGGGALITNHDVKEIVLLRDSLDQSPGFMTYPKRFMGSLYETRAFSLSKVLVDFVRRKNNLRIANDLDKKFTCSEVEAYLALRQLKSLKSNIRKRSRNFNYLSNFVKTQKIEEKAQSSHNYLSIIASDRQKAESLLKKSSLFLFPWKGSKISDKQVFVPNSPKFNRKKIDSFVKENTNKVETKKNNALAVSLALICTVIISVAQILLKFGSEAFNISLNQIYNYPLVGGMALYFMGAIVLVYAFRQGELSVVYPVTASSFVMVALLSIFFLNEVLVLEKWLSLGLITLGVSIVGLGGEK